MRAQATILFGACLVTALAAQRPQRVPPHFEPAGSTFVARHLDTRAQVVPGGVRLFGPLGHVDLRLGGAGDSSLHGSKPSGAISNYYLGNEWTRHREAVPHFQRVENPQSLPGVDLEWLCEGGQLRFDLHLAHGHLLAEVRIGSADWTQLRVDEQGCLHALAAGDELAFMPPRAFQGRELPCRFELGDGATVRFHVDGVDEQLPLHIDPVIRWSTWHGGSGYENVDVIDMHRSGHLAVIGQTSSMDLPLLAGTGQTNTGNNSYVLGFDPAGQLVFSTYFGGTDGGVSPRGGGLDYTGNVLMAGMNGSSTLPVASWVHRTTVGNWYMAQLNWGPPWVGTSAGTLGWCTYEDGGNMSAVHVSERQSVIYIGADWGGTYLPTVYSMTGAYVMAFGGGNQVGVATGIGVFCAITAIHGDLNSNIIIAGHGAGLPTTPNVFQPAAVGGTSPFVLEFSGHANGFGACTYFGDSSCWITDIEVLDPDPMAVAGTLVICGNASTGLPLLNAVRTAPANAFVARFNRFYTGIDYSTYIGQTNGMTMMQLDSDAQRRTYLTGVCQGPFDMPVVGALRGAPSWVWRSTDQLLVRLAASGQQIDYATYLGGLDGAGSNGVMAVGVDGSVAFGMSKPLPYWPHIGATSPRTGGSNDACVLMLSPDVLPAYGTGSPGSDGYVPWLSGGGVPAPGNTIRFQVMHGRRGSFGVLGLGSAPMSAPLFGGTMLINWPWATVTMVLSGPAPFSGVGGTGYGTYDLPVPPNPGLRGLPVLVQGIFVDSNALPWGVTLTNAVNASIQ